MTSIIDVRIARNGTLYSGKIATIEKTTFGIHEHYGIAMFELRCSDANGTWFNVGEHTLDDKPVDGRRRGSAFGMDHLLQVLRTVGVDYWEQLQGRKMIALFADGDEGGKAVGIASLDTRRVFLFHEHAAEYFGAKETTGNSPKEPADLSEPF